MALSVRATLLGLFSWLLPFAIAFVLFPVRKSNAPLYATLMYLIVLLTAGLLLILHFLHRRVSMLEACLVGLLWLAINLALDYPLFSHGPMRMSAGSYYSEIGLVYLTFPAFSMLAARLASS